VIQGKAVQNINEIHKLFNELPIMIFIMNFYFSDDESSRINHLRMYNNEGELVHE